MNSIPLWAKLVGGIGILAAGCVAMAFVPTGEVAYAPVDPIDIDGKVRVGGSASPPVQGHMFLVGVTERPVNLLQRLLLDVGDPNVDFGPEPERAGPHGVAEDVDAMATQKQVAAGLAFRLTGDEVTYSGRGAAVVRVLPGSPAAAALRPGDVVVKVDDQVVDTSVEVIDAIGSLPPGTRVVLGVRREGRALRTELRTRGTPEQGGPARSRIGAELTTLGLEVDLPRPVTIDSGEVVGPSAGLAFALYLYDALSERDDLLRGRYVVATGALSVDGQVHPVGRVRQKAVSAQLASHDLFVVPAANAQEARDAVADTCRDESGCTVVVGVASVQEAVELMLLDDASLAERLAVQ